MNTATNNEPITSKFLSKLLLVINSRLFQRVKLVKSESNIREINLVKLHVVVEDGNRKQKRAKLLLSFIKPFFLFCDVLVV